VEAMSLESPSEPSDLRQLSTPERTRLLLSNLWIPYPVAEDILEELEEWLEYPQGNSDPPGMTLYGPTGAGKSWVAKEFRDRHPREAGIGEEAMSIPVLYFVSPAKATPDEVYRSMLMALGGPIGKGDLKTMLLNRLVQAKTKVVIADEIHNALSVSSKRMAAQINAIKNLPDELNEKSVTVGFLLVGTRRALAVIQTAEELYRRFPPRHLALFASPQANSKLDGEGPGGGMRQFLADLEEAFPLREVSGLSSYEFALFVFGKCGGYRHNIANLLKSSARYALRKGKEQLSEDLVEAFIKEKFWKPPAQIQASDQDS
jgi:Bacterial TniB protein